VKLPAAIDSCTPAEDLSNMLKILHTADWHLGQSLHGYSREPEHAAFLDWLLLQLQEHQPHALLLAGDVFDTIHPAATAQKLFYSFLSRARQLQPDLQLVITAGNHDAGSRLEAPAGLLDAFSIHIVGTPLNAAGTELDFRRLLVPLRGDSGQTEAIVIAMPFLRPADVPTVPAAEDPWLAGIRAAYEQAVAAAAELRAETAPGAALIAIGHCHLAGGLETLDSERRLVVGHAEAIGLDTFPPALAYVALGHLHRAQQFQQGRIRYSGSPIPLSFTEAAYQHQILCLDFAGGQLQSVQSIPVPRTVSRQCSAGNHSAAAVQSAGAAGSSVGAAAVFASERAGQRSGSDAATADRTGTAGLQCAAGADPCADCGRAAAGGRCNRCRSRVRRSQHIDPGRCADSRISATVCR
jgi:exonuclease SbcD